MDASFAEKFGSLIARALLAAIFIQSGLGKIVGFSGAAAYMAGHGMPVAELFLVGAIAVELGGGLALLLGWQARWAALALFLFIIPTTLIFHAYWAVPEAQARNQEIHFMKNLAIMGGMLMVWVFGPGPLRIGGGR
ncbi:MAG: DoxX family membrane protein [Azospirillum sp.]|nr:DoxX family membrane protein [Azospirillum sp.]